MEGSVEANGVVDWYCLGLSPPGMEGRGCARPARSERSGALTDEEGRRPRMTTRRLAAILAADVVGFSSMMERNEEGTLARLCAPWSTVSALRCSPSSSRAGAW